MRGFFGLKSGKDMMHESREWRGHDARANIWACLLLPSSRSVDIRSILRNNIQGMEYSELLSSYVSYKLVTGVESLKIELPVSYVS